MSRSAEIESDREIACVFLNRPEAIRQMMRLTYTKNMFYLQMQTTIQILK